MCIYLSVYLGCYPHGHCTLIWQNITSKYTDDLFIMALLSVPDLGTGTRSVYIYGWLGPTGLGVGFRE